MKFFTLELRFTEPLIGDCVLRETSTTLSVDDDSRQESSWGYICPPMPRCGRGTSSRLVRAFLGYARTFFPVLNAWVN